MVPFAEQLGVEGGNLKDIQDMRNQEGNQYWRGLVSQGYLFWNGAVVFGADDGENGIDSLI